MYRWYSSVGFVVCGQQLGRNTSCARYWGRIVSQLWKAIRGILSSHTQHGWRLHTSLALCRLFPSWLMAFVVFSY